MSDTILVALIVAVPPTLMALGALITSIKNSTKLGEVAVRIDGRMEALLEATKAKGRLEEQVINKIETQRQEVRQDAKDVHTYELLAQSVPGAVEVEVGSPTATKVPIKK